MRSFERAGPLTTSVGDDGRQEGRFYPGCALGTLEQRRRRWLATVTAGVNVPAASVAPQQV